MRNGKDSLAANDNVIVMPDVYAERLTARESELESIELVANDDDPEFGFDPYDTARFFREKKQ